MFAYLARRFERGDFFSEFGNADEGNFIEHRVATLVTENAKHPLSRVRESFREYFIVLLHARARAHYGRVVHVSLARE